MAINKNEKNLEKVNNQNKIFTIFKKINILYILGLLLIIASFLIGVLVTKVRYLEQSNSLTLGQAQDQGLDPQQPEPQVKVNIKDVDIKNEPFIGDENAPITLAYWFDFQCPFCQKFESETMSTLIERYVNTGKLKIVFKDFQFLGPDSTTAGLAENAVWEVAPQSYKAWHEAMYKNQDAENGGWGKKEDIITMTRSIPGIDADQVSLLMEQNKDKYQKELDDDNQEGVKLGVSGTPGFVIGDQSISGAQPLSTFTQIIDALLKK